VSVPRVLDLVQSRTPVEVEEMKLLGGNIPTRYQSGTVGREGGDLFMVAHCGRIYFRRGADEL